MQYHAPMPSDKNPNIAIVLELFPGLIGFPGLGWVYIGEFSTGLMVLLGYWFYAASLSFLIIAGLTIITVVTLGLGGFLICLIPATVILFYIPPILSAVTINNRLNSPQQTQTTQKKQPQKSSSIASGGGVCAVYALIISGSFVVATALVCGLFSALGVFA